ncbi:hypothetical protein RUM44_008953 [Polyplax serrata]|uniref:Uncharacterized protein n=1 Tax=Polyplax serrata TaxID=468196 RepID=A0ABR1ARD6_POLSC
MVKKEEKDIEKEETLRAPEGKKEIGFGPPQRVNLRERKPSEASIVLPVIDSSAGRIICLWQSARLREEEQEDEEEVDEERQDRIPAGKSKRQNGLRSLITHFGLRKRVPTGQWNQRFLVYDSPNAN